MAQWFRSNCATLTEIHVPHASPGSPSSCPYVPSFCPNYNGRQHRYRSIHRLIKKSVKFYDNFTVLSNASPCARDKRSSFEVIIPVERDPIAHSHSHGKLQNGPPPFLSVSSTSVMRKARERERHDKTGEIANSLIDANLLDPVDIGNDAPLAKERINYVQPFFAQLIHWSLAWCSSSFISFTF